MRKQQHQRRLDVRPQHARREYRERVPKINHRIHAASEEIVGHRSVPELPEFE
ncbi:hypothetical protein [Burkholderia ubonensis]|uniref:hypothetical protein n=1 Tax=Burkholderia ubonensis TaxID=101571 RepID=UPI0012F894FA|nr:hypothetical protein [Burkholderia ubonensis]